MFLRRLPSARRRLVAVTLFLLTAFTSGPFVFPHIDPGGDVEHAGTFESHDADAHQIGAAKASDLHQHCAVCHLVRTSCAGPQHSGIISHSSLSTDRVSTPLTTPSSLRH